MKFLAAVMTERHVEFEELSSHNALSGIDVKVNQQCFKKCLRRHVHNYREARKRSLI